MPARRRNGTNSPTRRRLLAAGGAAAGAALAGCLSTGPGEDDATESPCSATDPPAPTDAAAPPKGYPERPDELTADAVGEFLGAYESAYRYNAALADDPDKVGRTNEVQVHVSSVSVESDGDGYAAEVTGQVTWEITDTDGTPATPTETPLPMGHRPFETAYAVTDRKLRREGTVVECW